MRCTTRDPQYKPTHVLNAAGLTGRPNVDWCETHKLETIRANVIGCLNLADVCNTHNIHMTYYGTGCIFHYDEDFPVDSGKGFKESDKPNFTGSYYSHTKVGTLTAGPHFRPQSAALCSWPLQAGQQARASMQRAVLLTTTCWWPYTFGWVPGLLLTSLSCSISPPQAIVENLVKEYPNVLILRVRMPIVADLTYPRNFITKIIKYDKVGPLSLSVAHVHSLLLPAALFQAPDPPLVLWGACRSSTSPTP